MTEADKYSLTAYLKSIRSPTVQPEDTLQIQPDLKEWVWGPGKWGKPVLVCASLAAARLAREFLKNWSDQDNRMISTVRKSGFDKALEAAEDWLSSADDSQPVKAQAAATAVWKDVEIIAFNAEELPATAEVCASRNDTLLAANSIAWAVTAAAWSAETAVADVLPEETAEIEARIASGPAFETVQAVENVRAALHLSEAEMYPIIRNAVLGWLNETRKQ